MERKAQDQLRRSGGVSKGTGFRKMGASVYFLELTPNVQQQGSGGNVRHSHHSQIDAYGAQYHPTRSTTHRHSQSKMHPSDSNSVCDAAIMPSKDNVIIMDSRMYPGVLVVYRLPEVRAANPDRLNLDQRRLTMVPIFEGEERLQMLNLQHNSITLLQNLSNLHRLVFLDLYDNLLHELNGLNSLPSLRVLMLGRNRIRKISGFQTLTKLDVLDLHGNMITVIEGLSLLLSLRILNMAGNSITRVSGVVQLQSLEEVNVSRNRVTNVYEVDKLPKLSRLFLSHNHIQSFDDASSILHCGHLKELTLNGNPLAYAANYRQSVIFRVKTILKLDQTNISDREWHEMQEVVHKEEQQKRESKKQELLQEYKAVTIAAIRKNWEHTHYLMPHTTSSIHSPNMVSASDDSSSSKVVRKEVEIEEQVPDSFAFLPQKLHEVAFPFFLDCTEEMLHLYGQAALEEVEGGKLIHNKLMIQHVHFHCIEFEDIARWLPNLLLNCPKVSDLSFDCTNLSGLEQLNALAQIASPLSSLFITPHGNPVTMHPLFTSYTIYRLHHLNLTLLNGVSVEDEAVAEAEQMFRELSQQRSTRLPKTRLLSLINKSQSTKRLRNSPLIKSSNESLNSIGLQLFSTTSQPPCVVQKDRVTSAQVFTSDLLESTLLGHNKVTTFEMLWPKIMGRLVCVAMEEYSDMDRHMKDMLADF